MSIPTPPQPPNGGPAPPPPPPPPAGGGPLGVKPESYLVWGIVTALLCCLPFGIVSIVYAAKVDAFWAGGQHASAIEASRKAKKWAIIAAATAGAIGALWVVLTFVLGVAAA